MKHFWKPLIVFAILAGFTVILHSEHLFTEYHTIVLQLFTFTIVILGVWLRKWLFPAVAYFVLIHIALDYFELGSFPLVAFRESVIHFGFATAIYVILEQRDHSRIRLKNYIDASRIATWEWNLKKNVMTYNERWAQMLGYTLAELKPITVDTWKHLAHPDDVKASQDQVERVLAGTLDMYEYKARLRHKNGDWVWIQDRGKVVAWSRKGKPLVMSGTHTDITLEQTLTEKIRIQNERFMRLVDSLPEIIYELDLAQRHTAIYGKWLKDLQRDPAFFLGKTAREVFGAEAEPHEKAFERVLRGETVVYDWHMSIAGRKAYYQTSLSPIVAPDGTVLAAAGIGRDVTALHEAEERILHSHKLMQYIIEHSNSAIAVHDRDLRYLYVSDNYLNQYNVADRVIIGRHHYDVFPDLPQKWRDVHQRTLKGEIVTGDRDPYPHEDGTVDYTRWESRPWYEDDGSIGGLIIYTEVITERVRMEQEIMKKADQLYIQKQQADATLLSIGDGVVSTDQAGNIVAFNKVAEQLTGWTADEAIGRSFEDVFRLINEASRKNVTNPVRRALDAGHKIELENHTLLLSRSGKEFHVEDSAAPIITADGRLTGVVLVFRDVTEKQVKQREIEYLSNHDFMTGLYNRRHFVERMAQMDSPGHYPLGVVMGDFNGLKILNDAFGHDLGDEALRRIALVLTSTYRKTDVIARIGGDEFAVILPNTDEAEIEALAETVHSAVWGITLNNVHLSMAIGYAVKKDALESIDDILKQAENSMYARKISEGSSVRNRTIQAILGTLTDKYEKEKIHSERVSRICGAIGRALGLRADDQKELEMAGLYHDIGKIAIPDVILNKTGKLTPEEFEIMKKHTEVGYQILRAADEYSGLAEYALSHQERWDGKGYPRNLRGTDIPLISRIISVADAWEAMTSDRPYRAAMTIDLAAEQMRIHRGTQFDPDLVDVFLNSVFGKESL